MAEVLPPRPLSPLQKHARDAAQQFAGSVTVPIMHPIQQRLVPVGTGTFVGVNERLFIVAASHLFKDRNLERFFVPSKRVNGKAVKLIGTIVRPSRAQNVDIAIVEILDEKLRETIRAGWNRIELQNTAVAADNGLFVLCGYPQEYQSERDGDFEYGVLTAFTTRLDYIPANATEPVDGDLDLFFEYTEGALEHDGTVVVTPRLHGASGASVWQYIEDPGDGLWMPERALRVVAVQSSAFPEKPPHQWFRAKSWEAVRDALRYKDEELRAALNS